jgi:hypothetical protein
LIGINDEKSFILVYDFNHYFHLLLDYGPNDCVRARMVIANIYNNPTKKYYIRLEYRCQAKKGNFEIKE